MLFQSIWLRFIGIFVLTCCSGSCIAGNNSRDTSPDQASLIKALNLNTPGLEQVSAAVEEQNSPRAWQELLKHFRKRGHLADPQIERWQCLDNGPLTWWTKDATEFHQGRYLLNGRIDWIHANNPPHRLYESYWIRNRLLFLGEWTATANATGRPDLRKTVAKTFLDWFRQCPPPERSSSRFWDRKIDGFAWRELEVALRARVLISVFFAALEWSDVPSDFYPSLLVAIKESMDYLTGHYDRVGHVPKNHQNSHGVALLAAGVLLPELKDAVAWKALGLRILREHSETDFDGDGVQVEHSPMYHWVVFNLYLDAYELLSLNNQQIPDWLWKLLNASADFLLHSTSPNGRLVPVNDSWNLPSRSSLRRAAKMLRRPDLLAIDRVMPAAELPPVSRHFPEAGFVFMRSGWTGDATFVVLDASGHKGGHWHAGKPNLIIHAGNQILASDPQIASYDDSSFYRYFKTAHAHNTVLVDGRGASQPKGRWRFRGVSSPRLTFFCSRPAVDIARATNHFQRNSDWVQFERTVVFLKPHLIFVHDVLLSPHPHRYSWLLHLVPQEPIVDDVDKSLKTALGGPFELYCKPAPGMKPRLEGPVIKKGLYHNQLHQVRGSFWPPPEPDPTSPLLVSSPYGVWTQRGNGKVIFDFAVHVLPESASRPKVLDVKVNVNEGVAAYRVVKSDGEALILFDDRPVERRSPQALAGLHLEGRVGVAVDHDLVSDGKLIWQQSYQKREFSHSTRRRYDKSNYTDSLLQ